MIRDVQYRTVKPDHQDHISLLADSFLPHMIRLALNMYLNTSIEFIEAISYRMESSTLMQLYQHKL